MTFTDRVWLRFKRSLDRARPGTSINFDLQADLHGRHAAYLLWALSARHVVRVRDHEADLLRHMLPLGHWMRHTVLARGTPDANSARVVVAGDSAPVAGHRSRVARLKEDWFRPLNPASELRVPYFMHPRTYRNGLMRTLPALRARPSRFLVGFAGSVVADYGRTTNFELLSRPEVLAAARAAFGPQALSLGTAATASAASARRAFVYSVTDVAADNLEKHALSQQRYLEFVAECDFFLCPPGWMMPPSHNLIEAMSVGTIPILNYNRYFDPRLRDGVNCLLFSTVEDLRQLPARIDRLPPAQLESMRTAVLASYQEHLDGGAFAQALLDHPAQNLDLIYNSEGGSIARLNARATARAPQGDNSAAAAGAIHPS